MNAPNEIPTDLGNDAVANENIASSNGAAGSSSDIDFGRRLSEAESAPTRTLISASASVTDQQSDRVSRDRCEHRVSKMNIFRYGSYIKDTEIIR